ncbi:MAG: hypothetical protein ACO1Q7_02135 [Gemmatimonas sp.]
MNTLIAWVVKRVWPIGAVMATFTAMSFLRVHDLQKAERAKVVAIDSATTFTRDSVNTAARMVLDSASREIQRTEGALAVAKRQADRAQRLADVRASSNAAAQRLYASLQALNDSLRGDTTVRALSSASEAVAAENDTLKETVVAVVETARQERVAADALHAADTAAIRGLVGSLGGARDSLAVEARRPKRTKKAVAIAGAVGYVGLRAIEFAIRRRK